ncbi:activity-dependent neuroprotector homeobox protein 2 isoform X2 [Rhinoderma darwinii]|uniref:activity-dependent neuroprotector homeobox protein 2 isoform X2 n=1 Tax=Rhinoderma darwinii TaxID=43563 RepID=UPI003F66662C
MFQTPVTNLEKIRRARKRVKQLLLQIGLETCRDAFEHYRSKRFCCSLCKFSTRLLSTFKSHLRRYHEDEKDQELMSACPSCPFTSQTKNVVKHMRIFHSSVRKVQSAGAKESPNTVRFSCTKCSYTDVLYYSLKRHGLMTHHHDELEHYFGEKTEEQLKCSSVFKINPDRLYCKKCNFITSNRDALIFHIITSDKHRDLDLKLRTDISDSNRPRVRGAYKKSLIPTVALPPKSPVLVPNATPVPPPATQDVKVISLPQNGPDGPLVGAPNPLIQKIVPVSTVSEPAGSLGQKISTTVAPSAQVGFVTAQLSQNQSITLQASLPQSVFLSPRFPLNQPVTATVLSSGGQIISRTQAGVRSVLPMNQTLALNQSTVLTCPQSLQSALINVNTGMRPTVFPVNQSVRPNNILCNQAGIPQNTILTSPILRQLIPTGKQVNGIPTYTLAPISVTLPVTPCALPAVKPPKVPARLSRPDKRIQVSTSPASAPSPVIQLAQNMSQQPPNPTVAKSPVIAPPALGKEAKQWKTCPVCNELFPSNVYEVHMQIAHIKQENSPDKPIETSTTNEAKEVVVIAAHASFLKVLKDKSIRCVTCKTFTDKDDEVLKHLLMHGMICLYCKAVFHELRNFVYHMKILHVGKKKVHGDFVKKGITISNDANGEVVFPYFDLTFNTSREQLGDKEMHLAVVTGSNAMTAKPIYIKILYTSEFGGIEEKASKCQFCNSALSRTEGYETHLKEKHHIMPTVHTILKTPAFKCIHCCGVYTGSMTLAAISVHLQRCRNAPKDSTSGAELVPENGESANDYVKPNTTGDTQGASNESKNKYGPNAAKVLSPMSSKRRRLEPDPLESTELLHSLDILEMIPDASATVSHESKKEFLSKYFHKKPYPSKQEIELLSGVLGMWKSDVASFFGTKRYVCLKFLRNHKQRVILGFKMAELKRVQHEVDLREDY